MSKIVTHFGVLSLMFLRKRVFIKMLALYFSAISLTKLATLLSNEISCSKSS